MFEWDKFDDSHMHSFEVHQMIPWSRCQVFQAMLDGHFKESNEKKVLIPDTKKPVFESFLEYLYTDHVGFQDKHALDLLMLSNRFGVSRLLSWCEYRMSKIVEKACTQQIEKSNFDVIGLLLLAQKHNAKQLSGFCLHFISTNYAPLSRRKEFGLLEGENKTFVEEHRWPPKLYEEKCVEYEKELKAWNKKYGNGKEDSSCLVM